MMQGMDKMLKAMGVDIDNLAKEAARVLEPLRQRIEAIETRLSRLEISLHLPPIEEEVIREVGEGLEHE